MAPPLSATQVRALLSSHTTIQLPSGEELRAMPDAAGFLDALAEASFLVSQGDHILAPGEIGCLVNTLSELSAGELDRSVIAGMFYEFSSTLKRDGLTARIDQLAARFPDARERLRLIAFAALVAMCDRVLQPGEREVIQTLAARMGVPAGEVESCVDALQKNLHDAKLRCVPCRFLSLCSRWRLAAATRPRPRRPRLRPRRSPPASVPTGPWLRR